YDEHFLGAQVKYGAVPMAASVLNAVGSCQAKSANRSAVGEREGKSMLAALPGGLQKDFVNW
ncbi:TPA: hypothetical protein ACG4OS_006440, partial [Pseudomonas aeruginosa]